MKEYRKNSGNTHSGLPVAQGVVKLSHETALGVKRIAAGIVFHLVIRQGKNLAIGNPSHIVLFPRVNERIKPTINIITTKYGSICVNTKKTFLGR